MKTIFLRKNSEFKLFKYENITDLSKELSLNNIKISSSAIIGDSVQIGDHVQIGDNATICNLVAIGDGVQIGYGATIDIDIKY